MKKGYDKEDNYESLISPDPFNNYYLFIKKKKIIIIINKKYIYLIV